MSLLVALAWVWLGAACLSRVLAAFAAASDLLRHPAEAPRDGAARDMALLRPLHGAPPPLERCLESLAQAAEAAGVPVITGCADPDDPARAIVARVRERHPVVAWTEVTGAGPPGRNRKVASLARMASAADADVLILSDADVAVPPDYVARHTTPLADPAVGLVTCPYRSVPAGGLASRLDALVTNVWFLPYACLAVRVEGCHFGLGASICVRREALDKLGGFVALVDEPADDWQLAHRVELAGYRLAWLPMLVDHVLEREGFFAVARRHARWSGTVRSVRGLGYLGLVLTYGLPPALFVALASRNVFVLAPVFWWALLASSLAPLRRRLGLAIHDYLLLPLAELLGFAAWIAGWFRGAGAPGDRAPDKGARGGSPDSNRP